MENRIRKAIESKVYTSCEHKPMFSPCEIGFEFSPSNLCELPTQNFHIVEIDGVEDEIEVEYTLISMNNNTAVYDCKKVS